MSIVPQKKPDKTPQMTPSVRIFMFASDVVVIVPENF